MYALTNDFLKKLHEPNFLRNYVDSIFNNTKSTRYVRLILLRPNFYFTLKLYCSRNFFSSAQNSHSSHPIFFYYKNPKLAALHIKKPQKLFTPFYYILLLLLTAKKKYNKLRATAASVQSLHIPVFAT